MEVTAPLETFHYCGRNNDYHIKTNTLRVGTRNVLTMIDRNTGDTRAHRRTALIVLELSRYNVDKAALSEMGLAGEGSLTEVGGSLRFFMERLS